MPTKRLSHGPPSSDPSGPERDLDQAAGDREAAGFGRIRRPQGRDPEAQGGGGTGRQGECDESPLARRIVRYRKHLALFCRRCRPTLPFQSTLVQEQSERARLLTQMREMLSGNGGSGAGSSAAGSKSSAVASEELVRLRGEVIRCHEETAAAKAGRERAEAQAASWKGEARSLKDRLMAVERVREDEGGKNRHFR